MVHDGPICCFLWEDMRLGMYRIGNTWGCPTNSPTIIMLMLSFAQFFWPCGWFRIYRTGLWRRISIVYDLATYRSSTSMWTWHPSLNSEKIRHAPAMKKYDNMMTKSQGHFLTFARIAAGVTKRPVRSSGET